MRAPSAVLAVATFVALAALHACDCGGPPPGDPDAGDGGPDYVLDTPFTISTVDSTAPAELKPIAMAVLPGDRVGIAYYQRTGTDYDSDAGVGVGLYEVRYREWNAGSVSAPVTVNPNGPYKRVVGVAIAAQPSGDPAIAYLGGNDPPTVQAFWFQNDAYLSYRTGTAWNTSVVVRMSNEAPGPNALSNNGYLVGLHPALTFDGPNAYLVYRDCHNGAFPQQDWNASDLEVARGWDTTWDKRVIINADGVTEGKLAYGGHNQIVMANGQPAVIGDQMVGVPDGPGQNVNFFKRNADGTWTAPKRVMNIADTQLGPSLAYDPVVGYGVAAVEHAENLLLYSSSKDGVTWPSAPEQVFQSGTGGWYPSLAFDPAYHEPEIAYYYCDGRVGVAADSCRTSQDELRITYRVAGRWSTRLVDPEGGWAPKLAFLSTGKRVVVYRDPRTAVIKIAVEQ